MIFTKYSQAYERSFPLVPISRKIIKDKKWITPGIRISINQKAYLYRTYLNYLTERNKTIYKKYRNILTSVIRKAEEMYYQHLMDDKKKNFKSLWEIYSPVINP